MTTSTATRTLEQNLDFLRLIGDGHLADMVLQLPADRQATAAACIVRREAPIHDAVLDASDDERPAVLGRILAGEVTR